MEIGIYYTYIIVFSDYIVFEGTNYRIFVQLCVIFGYYLDLHHNGKHVLYWFLSFIPQCALLFCLCLLYDVTISMLKCDEIINKIHAKQNKT
jgi:hypothetical protein